MTEVSFKTADAGDVELLLEMMGEFYAHERMPFDARATLPALRRLLADDSLGRVYVVSEGGAPAGYVALTLGFSLEFHGRDAFVDEIYVRESHRGRGLGTRALRFVEGVCRELGVRAMHLEVGRENAKAQSVYRAAGFVGHEGYLMTKRTEPAGDE